jgi:hypothetical protein
MQIILALALVANQAAAQAHSHASHHHAAAPDSVTAAALARQVDSVRKAVARYADVAAAQSDGYVKFGQAEGPLMGEHWFRRDMVDRPLDLTRPSTLQYATINGKRTLVGVAYTVYRKPSEPIPEGFAGESDHWHVHDISKLQGAITEGRPLLSLIVRSRNARNNPALAQGRNELTMVHAWTGLENPDGLFAEKHRALPYLRAGLPPSYAEGATENAAWGVALLQPGACDAEVRSTNGLARLTRQQQSRLDNACSIAAGKVLASFRKKDAASLLNAVADAAWTTYLGERDRTLTAEQKKRMASVVEHPMSGG